MFQSTVVVVQPGRSRALRRGFTAAVILVASIATSDPARAVTTSPTFARADYAFLGNNHVVADFNGDGSLDLAGSGARAAAVQLNNGLGTFGARIEYPVASWTQDLAAGDFNSDGKVDLVVTINDPQIGLSLLTGRGDGTFNLPVNFANTSGFDSPAVVAVDLNNDGKLDVVIAHQIACYTAPCIATMLMSVMIGNGDGTFQPTRDIDVGRGMSKIAVGDFNRDGFKDLAIAGDNSRVYRLNGVGDGTFVQQPTLTLITDVNNIGMDNTDIDVADFNGDTIQDLVVAVALNGSRTAILIGNGDGTFRAPLLITEPNLDVPQYQAVADYNGDGFQDLAISLGDGTRGLMEILNGNGDGTFQPLVHYLVPPPLSSIAGYAIVAANLNGDIKPDITLGISGASPALAVLMNSTGVTPPATPAAPTLLSPAQDATPAQPVFLDWTDVSAAASYRIQIDDSSTFSIPIVVDRTVTASQFTAPTLAAVRHWWRVQGINSAGTAGAWSSVRRFTPQTSATAPTLSAITLSPTSVVGGGTSSATATLTSAAPAGGAVVTLSSSTTTATVPASVTVASGATSATFTVNTTTVTASTPVTITGTFGGVTRSATLTVTPPAASASLSAVSVNPTTVTGGTSSQGTVTLTSAAPAGGFAVALSSSNTATATVAASVVVAQGTSIATFAITTNAVATSTPVTITASAAGVARTAALSVTAPAQAATLTVTATGRSGERITSSPAGINVIVGGTGSATFATGTVITLSATNGRDVVWSGACSSAGNKTKTCSFTLNGAATVTGNVQ